jgi:hypothetical protein
MGYFNDFNFSKYGKNVKITELFCSIPEMSSNLTSYIVIDNLYCFFLDHVTAAF